MSAYEQLEQVNAELARVTTQTPLEEVARLLGLQAAAEHLRAVEAEENRRRMYAPEKRDESSIQNASLGRISRQARFEEVLGLLPAQLEQARASYASTHGMPFEVREWHRVEVERLEREKRILEAAYGDGVESPAEVARPLAVVRVAALDVRCRLKEKHITAFGVSLESLQGQRDGLVNQFQITPDEWDAAVEGVGR